ncbi:hypothetical protein SAMN05443529_12923 [Desulfosporosinus hippei DSM 8344]|uniref:Uncharacterized protein n=1 Tax=Desulfosporosinus hippei DSM 8344 TaxID=1121419 RepID=A0A1G8ILZ4_9FIRM|nr:hypothetical protein SAMN05443529_12923 [Desulfosporosinus hippei DSM 8344]
MDWVIDSEEFLGSFILVAITVPSLHMIICSYVIITEIDYLSILSKDLIGLKPQNKYRIPAIQNTVLLAKINMKLWSFSLKTKLEHRPLKSAFQLFKKLCFIQYNE